MFFDLLQYNEFCEYANDEIAKGGRLLSILPGVEIDIKCTATKDEGHIVLVTSNKNKVVFSEMISKWIKNKNEEDKIDIDIVLDDTKKYANVLYWSLPKRASKFNIRDYEIYRR